MTKEKQSDLASRIASKIMLGAYDKETGERIIPDELSEDQEKIAFEGLLLNPKLRGKRDRLKHRFENAGITNLDDQIAFLRRVLNGDQ